MWCLIYTNKMWSLTYTNSLGTRWTGEYETYEKAEYARSLLSKATNEYDSSFIEFDSNDSIFVIRIHMNDGTYYQVMTLFHTRAEAENYILNSPVNRSEDRVEIVEYAPIPF